MKRQERLARLSRHLQSDGALHLSRAAHLLSVSEMTVRRDLASAPGSFAYLGGHILPAGVGPRYQLDMETDAHVEAKAAAGRIAAASVAADATLFLDCGTTTPHVVAHLPRGGMLTVVCYALNIANALATRPDIRMILIGGLFYPSSATFYSEEALRAIDHLGITHAMVSAGGVHEGGDVSCSHFHEVPVKRAAMRRALTSTLLVDTSKLGITKPARFADHSEFDAMVTEAGLTPLR